MAKQINKYAFLLNQGYKIYPEVLGKNKWKICIEVLGKKQLGKNVLTNNKQIQESLTAAIDYCYQKHLENEVD